MDRLYLARDVPTPTGGRGGVDVVAGRRPLHYPPGMHSQGQFRRVRTAATIGTFAAVAMLLAACGGSSGSTGSGSSGSAAATRPEGRWTTVSWETGRSPAPANYTYGTASVSAVAYRPLCKTGPCEIAVRPDGVNGTYNTVGEPASDSDKAKQGSPYRLQWNATTQTYESSRDLGSVECTVAGAGGTPVQVPKGYTSKVTTSSTFTAPSKTAPAQLGGTRVATATGNPQSVAQGCTDFTVTGTTAAAPNGSITPDSTRAASTYRITEVVDSQEPAGQRPRGFVGILVPESTVTTAGQGIAITGVLGVPATLRRTAAGWTGSVSASKGACSGDGSGPAEFDAKESWIGLRPIALTKSGAPVLAGRWEYVANPNPAGVAAGCSLTTNKGYVILVPTAAIGS